MVRRLAGADLVATDFDETYGAGGYYAVRHPGLPQTLILVVNDVLWSAKYRDACGTGGEAAAEAMMTWLARQSRPTEGSGRCGLAGPSYPMGDRSLFDRAQPRRYLRRRRSCRSCASPMPHGFIALLRDYRDIIQASYSGHVHTDDYRLLVDERGNALGLQKIPPAISPIYGQNPGYQIVSYDLQPGAPTDFSDLLSRQPGRRRRSPVPGDWQLEYTFTEAYGLPHYSAEGVAADGRGGRGRRRAPKPTGVSIRSATIRCRQRTCPLMSAR